MFFLATADEHGFPNCSYKGGDPGFVRVVDEHTIAFPNFDGNGMYLSAGNLLRNPHVGMLFIDFERARRTRVNGDASVADDDPLLADYPEAQFVVRVAVRQVFPNCARYIHHYELVERSQFVPRRVPHARARLEAHGRRGRRPPCRRSRPRPVRPERQEPVMPTTDPQLADELVDAVRTFVVKEVLPVASEFEHADEYPEDLVEAMKGMGLLGCMIPEEYGGLGLDAITYSRIIEELSAGWMSLSGVLNTHTMVATLLKLHGTDKQKSNWLPRMATGEIRGALSLSEPDAGSDTRRCVARPRPTAASTSSTARRCG